MIKFENLQIVGWEPAIRGMRNPMNSWDKSDSRFNLDCDYIACDDCPTRGLENCSHALVLQTCDIGPNDHKLMMQLAKGGRDHAKYKRMLVVYVDIIAPLYWWKEFDTYKVGTVSNSCSTMHKIHAKEFELDDFSHEKLTGRGLKTLNFVIEELNYNRRMYVEGFTCVPGDNSRDVKPGNKMYWDNMIQLLPSSYNQRRTIELNYEVLSNMYSSRKNHKLDEWRELCKWIEGLPYSEVITGVER